MQSLGRRYVRYVNDRYHRTGTLWEGRYKACPVESDGYFLQCLRYIELNPVRAGMVVAPDHHPWSSFHRNALGKSDPLVRPHPSWLALADSETARCKAYRKFIMDEIDDTEIDAIRSHLQRQHAFGSARFRTAIEAQLGRRAGPEKIGRPRKAQSS
jgi:putative transposase